MGKTPLGACVHTDVALQVCMCVTTVVSHQNAARVQRLDVRAGSGHGPLLLLDLRKSDADQLKPCIKQNNYFLCVRICTFFTFGSGLCHLSNSTLKYNTFKLMH